MNCVHKALQRKYIIHKAVELDKVVRAKRPSDDTIRHTYVIQPKYDGVNVIVVIPALDAASCAAFTRTGEPILSMNHVFEAMVAFPGVEPGVYLGEAWSPDRPQNEISGAVRDTKQQHDWLKFVVFDYLTIDEFNAGVSSLPYAERVSRIPEPFFRIVEERAPVFPAVCEGTLADIGITAEEAARYYCQELQGYDGIVARDPAERWVAGSGTCGGILKFKTRTTYDLRIVGYLPGKGKHEGKVGTLLVEFNGKQMGAGTGLADDQRNIETFERDFLGKIAQVSALGITSGGLLREPTFDGLRFDKEEPDA